MGCCYHQITEGGEGGRRWNEDGRQIRAAEPNFPMSHAVRALSPWLGEMGRHLALQNVHAWGEGEGHTSPSLLRANSAHHFHRCLLELLLQRRKTLRESHLECSQPPLQGEVGSAPPPAHGELANQHPLPQGEVVSPLPSSQDFPSLPLPFSQGEVGRHSLPRVGNVGSVPHCASFTEYVRIASGKLGVEFEGGEVEGVEVEFGHLARPLHAFISVRAALARPIERLLLIDRFLFLKEQLGTGAEQEGSQGERQRSQGRGSGSQREDVGSQGRGEGSQGEVGQSTKMGCDPAARIYVDLVPIFDPVVSPRNTAVMSCIQKSGETRP